MKRTAIRTMSLRRRSEKPQRDAVREAVFERDGYACRLRVLPDHRCWGNLTAHHLRKASDLGRYVEANLIAVCVLGNAGTIEDDPTWAGLVGLVERGQQSCEETWQRLFDAGLSSSPEPGSAP